MNTKSNARVILPLVVGGVAAGAAAIASYRTVIRPWHLRWGASENEVKRVLPGDELVPTPHYNYTRAITINAPIEQVWQWVVQLGQNRGGLYSYERLENLFGANIHNAERVIPEYQNLGLGDAVVLFPNGPAYGVAQVDAPRTLVLRTLNQDTGCFTESVERDGIDGTWTFVLEPRIDHTTRLLVRARLDYQAGPAANALWGMVEPINFVMERKMLYGIKARAESHRTPNEMLDRVMPEYEFRGVESVVIHATPEQIFQAFREVRGSDMPLAQMLGQLRYLPEYFTKHGTASADQIESFADNLMHLGFCPLAEEPNRQLIVGAIAKFHDFTDQQFIPVHDPEEFRRFLHADYQKLAISLRVTDDNPAVGCTLTLEHRTHAMSEHARKQFAHYWIAIKPGGGFVTRELLVAVKHRAEKLAHAAKAADSKLPPQTAKLPVAPRRRQEPTPKSELLLEDIYA